MTEPTGGKLNQLERSLPEGLVVDSDWMTRHGYSTSLRSQYVTAGWLVQPTRGTFKRPLGTLTWERVVISLQVLLERPLIVGGRTALELQGFAHYLRTDGSSGVYLYGQEAPPGWLSKLPLKERFLFRRMQTLFKSDPVTKGLVGFASNSQESGSFKQLLDYGEWPLTVSSPERALLELLDELPKNESFHQVDMLVEGLRNLGPRRLEKLLKDCKSVKVKRLFFWFAERHNHSWLKQIDRTKVNLGTGKRMLVKGGKLDPKYMITVPGDMNAPV